ncbi:hypothetical protein DIS24_g4467 [Lasiodiplodia hormozganensis]|uniref:BTB domain-containing protein n=1 Tax=Lasiodiplodia hormozganensis TaxID=869390 RepID=A0AA40D1Y5_9PEZI|nr:hypothetical protein DIS24_g4467 [Lasiodiplodia hormozganensis]
MTADDNQSAHPSQGPRVETIHDVTPYLYKTKDWADMTIVCGDNVVIMAHRAVICPRNRFFNGCCSLGFAETGTGRINLTEDAETVEGILEHLYDVQVSLIEARDIYGKLGEVAQDKIQENLEKLTRLYVASDKYTVTDLQDEVAKTFLTRFQLIDDPNTILHIAANVYEKTPFFDVKLRAAVVNHVQVHLGTILATEETSMVLMGNSDLVLDILKRIAPVLRQQTEALISESSNGNDQSSPTTPKKRKSPRIGTSSYALRNRTT